MNTATAYLRGRIAAIATCLNIEARLCHDGDDQTRQYLTDLADALRGALEEHRRAEAEETNSEQQNTYDPPREHLRRSPLD